MVGASDPDQFPGPGGHRGICRGVGVDGVVGQHRRRHLHQGRLRGRSRRGCRCRGVADAGTKVQVSHRRVDVDLQAA